MIKDHWLQQLQSPKSKQPLSYLSAQNILVTPDARERYEIISGVPNLLPIEDENLSGKSETHQKLGTDFHYREHYQKDAEVFDYFLVYEDGASRHEARRLHETIANEVPVEAKSILDVGCGNAWVAKQFASKGVDVFSLDIAIKNPVRALELYPFPNHFALVADVYALPFANDTFDCIIASEIIEHVADPALFIGQLIKVLKPGGKLIITTPFAEKIPYSLCVHCNQPTPQHAHLHSFTKDSLAKLVRRDQVQELKMKTFNNKALTKLQLHVFLQYLPKGLWQFIDGLANIIIRKPARLMMTLTKGSVKQTA